MKKTTVSVVTVCLNAEERIKETIESVLAQTYNCFEYIIIDGKSTDRTIDIINGYKEAFQVKDVPFMIFSEKDNGIFNAMNKAIFMCNGNWIHFLNAGDTFSETTILEKIFNYSYEENRGGIIYGDYYKKHGQKLVLCKAYPIEDIYERMCFCHQAVFTPKKALMENQFDETYHIAADHKLFIQLYMKNADFRYIAVPVANFDCSGISQQNKIELLREEYRIKKECRLFGSLIEKEIAGWKCRLKCLKIKIRNFKKQLLDRFNK